MIETQEIIERSIYFSLLRTLINEGYTVDPLNYDPNYDDSLETFKEDKQYIIDNHKYFISLFGAGNNQSRGEKTVPRIVINPRGFLPGDVGLERTQLVKDEGRYFVSEFPFESVNQYIDIHLIGNHQDIMRIMTRILMLSLPTRGYIKPYIYDKTPFDGNIYLEVINFFDNPSLEKGVMEKIYQYEVKDTILEVKDLDHTIAPIRDISLLLDLSDNDGLRPLINIQS